MVPPSTSPGTSSDCSLPSYSPSLAVGGVTIRAGPFSTAVISTQSEAMLCAWHTARTWKAPGFVNWTAPSALRLMPLAGSSWASQVYASSISLPLSSRMDTARPFSSSFSASLRTWPA